RGDHFSDGPFGTPDAAPALAVQPGKEDRVLAAREAKSWIERRARREAALAIEKGISNTCPLNDRASGDECIAVVDPLGVVRHIAGLGKTGPHRADDDVGVVLAGSGTHARKPVRRCLFIIVEEGKIAAACRSYRGVARVRDACPRFAEVAYG